MLSYCSLNLSLLLLLLLFYEWDWAKSFVSWGDRSLSIGQAWDLSSIPRSCTIKGRCGGAYLQFQGQGGRDRYISGTCWTVGLAYPDTCPRKNRVANYPCTYMYTCIQTHMSIIHMNMCIDISFVAYLFCELNKLIFLPFFFHCVSLLQFFLAFWRLNPGPHIYEASTLPLSYMASSLTFTLRGCLYTSHFYSSWLCLLNFLLCFFLGQILIY